MTTRATPIVIPPQPAQARHSRTGGRSGLSCNASASRGRPMRGFRLLDDLAHHDADGVRRRISRARSPALDPPRARNVLRWFLRQRPARAVARAARGDAAQVRGARAAPVRCSRSTSRPRTPCAGASRPSPAPPPVSRCTGTGETELRSSRRGSAFSERVGQWRRRFGTTTLRASRSRCAAGPVANGSAARGSAATAPVKSPSQDSGSPALGTRGTPVACGAGIRLVAVPGSASIWRCAARGSRTRLTWTLECPGTTAG